MPRLSIVNRQRVVHVEDGYKPSGGKSLSVCEGSFFSQSKLRLRQWLILLYWWVRQYPMTDAAEESMVSRTSAIQAYQYIGDVCSWRLTTVDVYTSYAWWTGCSSTNRRKSVPTQIKGVVLAR